MKTVGVAVALLFVMCLAVPVGGCGGEEEVLHVAPSVEKQLVDAASPACEGHGIEEAAVYTKEERLHPILLLRWWGGRHGRTDDLPFEWWPTSVNTLELVACASKEERVEVETCLYQGGLSPTLTRYRYQVELRIVEARTGETLDQTVLAGSQPRSCPMFRDWESTETELQGSHVQWGEVEAWLGQYVVGRSSSGQGGG